MDILDVLIALIFLFLSVTLIVSMGQEAFVSIFRIRAFLLRRDMRRLLGEQLADEVYEHPTIQAISPPSPWAGILSEKSSPPSYISAETFVPAFVDVLKRKSNQKRRARNSQSVDVEVVTAESLRVIAKDALGGNQSLQDSVMNAIDLAGPQLDTRLKALQGWYDSAMERTTVRYKAGTRYAMFFYGAVAAYCLNINTVAIVDELTKNPAAATKMVEAISDTYYKKVEKAVEAEANADEAAASPDEDVYKKKLKDIAALRKDLAALNYPIGQDHISFRALSETVNEIKPWCSQHDGKDTILGCELQGLNEEKGKLDKKRGSLVADIKALGERLKGLEESKKTVTLALVDLKARLPDRNSSEYVTEEVKRILDGKQAGGSGSDAAALEKKAAALSKLLATIEKDRRESAEDKKKALELLAAADLRLAAVLDRRTVILDAAGSRFQAWLRAIVGWFLTALAVSMGAPFWFDLLSKFLNVRGAGIRPATAR